MKRICEIGCLLAVTTRRQHPNVNEGVVKHIAQLLPLLLIR